MVSETTGWIDSMSVVHVAQALEIYPATPHPWGWMIPQMVTSLLIGTDNIGLAPGLKEHRTFSQSSLRKAFAALIKSHLVVQEPIAEVAKKSSLQKTRAYVRRNRQRVKAAYDSLTTTYAEEVLPWVDWGLRSWLPAHLAHYKSVFDLEFIPELKRLTDYGEDDIRRVHRSASSLDYVKRLVRGGSEGEELQIIRRCFLLCILLRGIYHDYEAKETKQQILHHPIRKLSLPQSRTRPVLLQQPSVEYYLANIVLHSACCESGAETRIMRWEDNIEKIRERCKPGFQEIHLGERADSEVALNEAVRAAKIADIPVHQRSLGMFLDALGASLLAAATSGLIFTFDPFSAFGTTALLSVASSRLKEGVASRLVKRVYSRTARMRDLAQAPPGRISVTNVP